MRDVKVSAADWKHFNQAAEIARDGEHYRVRVGAVLAKGRTPLSRGYNRVASWASDEPFKPGHAERIVIAGMPAIKCTLYVARLDLNDKLVASWPCGECMEHIVSCGCVKKIVYWDGENLRKVRI
jgi:deoxycytidylate deaminase